MPSTTTDPRRALSPQQLAARWDVCKQTLYNEMNAGRLRSFKVRARRLIPLDEIERIERGEKEQDQAA